MDSIEFIGIDSSKYLEGGKYYFLFEQGIKYDKCGIYINIENFNIDTFVKKFNRLSEEEKTEILNDAKCNSTLQNYLYSIAGWDVINQLNKMKRNIKR